jgi:hypothetical protein
MARQGTNKYASRKQEEYVARAYAGTFSPSSGAADNDAGDIRTPHQLLECKVTGVAKPAASISINIETWKKIQEEAWAEGKIPGMAMRVLAKDGKTYDFIVRLISDDTEIWGADC